jgi:peptidoglycan/xylan/chitin deacetylase (PgdA/CDA1 family)
MEPTSPPGRTIPILTYHSLDESGSVISVSPTAFAAQMRLLARRGYRGISLGQWITAREKAVSPASRPCGVDQDTGKMPVIQSDSKHPVILTFDDAFANVLDHAAPVLAELGFTATVFAVSDYCGKRNDWPTQPPGVPRLPLMSDGQLRQLASAGWEIGSHTQTHPRLAELPQDQIERELRQAQSQLQQRLGQRVQTLAYPYGSYNPRVRAAAARLYRAAVTVDMRLARQNDDPLALPRLDVFYWRNPAVFRLFGTNLGHAYLAARSLGRRCRALLSRGAA